MTTKSHRPVTRETSAHIRDRGLRPVIVTVVGGVLELRAKGLRSTEVIDVAWIYYSAVKQRVLRERTERSKASRRAPGQRGRVAR